jgi:hypothetical protein
MVLFKEIYNVRGTSKKISRKEDEPDDVGQAENFTERRGFGF